jgi:hypothetical protein
MRLKTSYALGLVTSRVLYDSIIVTKSQKKG